MAELVQNSLEWFEYRESKANASEAPAVMDAGLFQPRNKRELSMVRNGQLIIRPNEYMRRGTDLEAAVRTYISARHAFDYQPKVLEATIDGIPMSASLDGVHGQTWLEIKVCSSEQSKYWTVAQDGRIAESVRWQMQHQYMVCREHGIAAGALYVCQHNNISGGILIPFMPDESAEEQLLAGWKEIWPYIKDGKTYGERKDAEWSAAAAAYKLAKEALTRAEKQLDHDKKRLLDLANGENTSGCGVSVTEVTRTGGPDYSQLSEDVVAALPRKPDTTYKTINIIKSKE